MRALQHVVLNMRGLLQAAVSKADHTPPLLEHNSTIAIIATNTATRLKVKLKFLRLMNCYCYRACSCALERLGFWECFSPR